MKIFSPWGPRTSSKNILIKKIDIMGGSNLENPVLQYLNISKLSNSAQGLKPQLCTTKGNMYLYFQFLLVSTQVYKMFLVFSLQTNLISIPCKTFKCDCLF